MREEIRELWANRLESGQEKQVKSRLVDRVRIDGPKIEVGFCCLGVLTKCYIEDPDTPDDVRITEDAVEVKIAPEVGSLPDVWVEHTTNLLPPAVTAWAGLQRDDPYIGEETATRLNDEMDWDFVQIAAALRENDAE